MKNAQEIASLLWALPLQFFVSGVVPKKCDVYGPCYVTLDYVKLSQVKQTLITDCLDYKGSAQKLHTYWNFDEKI
jgi:hypothetical protein